MAHADLGDQNRQVSRQLARGQPAVHFLLVTGERLRVGARPVFVERDEVQPFGGIGVGRVAIEKSAHPFLHVLADERGAADDALSGQPRASDRPPGFAFPDGRFKDDAFIPFLIP